jgi:predicted acetyltransferase
MFQSERFVQSITVPATGLDALPVDRLRSLLNERLVVRVTGLFAREEVVAAADRLRTGFDRRRDRKHDPRNVDAIRGNLQKLQIGGASANNVARFLRIFYNPIFAEDIYGMREVFVRLARFRNRLFGLPDDFAVFGTDEGFWTAARVNQYPTGGGFMVAHRDQDVYVVRHDEADAKAIYQPLLLMSEKSRDFHAGGAFVEIDGQRIFYEDHCAIGDVLVYDGRAVHGVADIDPLEPLNLDHFCGRAVAFVTLFRRL